MKNLCVGLVVGFLIIGTAYGATIVPDNSGALRLYGSGPARPAFNDDTVSALGSLSSSVPTVDTDLNAKISPAALPYPPFLLHYRTYYKPGDDLLLWAQWRPFGDWGIDFVGKEVTIRITLSKGPNILFTEELKSTLTDGDAYWTGIGYSYTVPGTAKAGEAYTLHVSLSVSGVEIVNAYRSAPPTTKLHVTKETSSDLSIPFLDEFEQTNWAWGQDRLGTCKTTMGKEGDATTSKAFVFAYFSYPDYQNPGQLNECLTVNGGYTPCFGCLMPTNNYHGMALVCAPSDVVWDGSYTGPRLSERIDRSLNGGSPVITRTTQYGDAHYYVIVGKRGTDRWNVFDPSDGQIHMMETRGLANWMIKAIYLYAQW